MSNENITPETNTSIITKLLNRNSENADSAEVTEAKKTVKRFAWVALAAVTVTAVVIAVASQLGNDEESDSEEITED